MKKLLPLLLLIVPALAGAQQAWNENVIAWDAPIACTDGSAIANCPIASYQIERSATAAGTYVLAGTSTTRTFRHTVTAAGLNCYKVRAVGASGASDPSSPPACVTNVQPPPPVPNPPTNVRIVTAAIASLGGMSPVYSVTAGNKLGTFYGLLPAGRDCMKDYPVDTYRGLAFYRVGFNPRELWAAPPAGVNLAAACAGPGA